MHELLPMCTLMHEITNAGLIHIQLDECGSHTITTSLEQSKLFEDNALCIALTTTDQFHPCTKHIGIKWCHFKAQVHNRVIWITKVNANYNWADIFIKPLIHQKHKSLRKLPMGW